MIDSEQIVRLDSDDAQRLDAVLADARVPGLTRRHLVQRAAVTAAAAGAAGMFGPVGSALAQGSGNDPQTVLNTAITAEALAVTYLTGVIGNVHGAPVSKFESVLKAANQAEYDHYRALQSLGAKPITTKFWVPDALLKADAVFPTLEVAETLFVNAYLIGTTTFAKAGKASAARYAGEILGVEAQHRTLARFAQGKLPNDVSFEQYAITSIDGIVAKLEGVGIGFGKKGSKSPGAFHSYKTPPHSALTAISSDKPQ